MARDRAGLDQAVDRALSSTANPGITLRIADGHAPARYRALFEQAGRIHIPGFLEAEAARSLHERIAAIADWRLFVNDKDRTAQLSMRDLDALGARQCQEMALRIQRDAQTGFQFQYLQHNLSDAGEPYAGSDPVGGALVAFLNSPAFIGFAREVCGDDAIAYADGQISRYEPGHFLTRHNDLRPRLGRRVAYVINLTPHWRVEWGGVLEFLDADGHVSAGYVPAFNAINLFRVPQMHHVSSVAPFAGAPRLSITGWLRAR
ncbi:MAG: 2OG-Fe(II) oxygenase family protein [Nevskia sp.]